jgi:hypothetical protein
MEIVDEVLKHIPIKLEAQKGANVLQFVLIDLFHLGVNLRVFVVFWAGHAQIMRSARGHEGKIYSLDSLGKIGKHMTWSFRVGLITINRGAS